MRWTSAVFSRWKCVSFSPAAACCYDQERHPVLESDLREQREATLLFIKNSSCFVHLQEYRHMKVSAHAHTSTQSQKPSRREGGRRTAACFTGKWHHPPHWTNQHLIYPRPHQDAAMMTVATSFGQTPWFADEQGISVFCIPLIRVKISSGVSSSALSQSHTTYR